MMTIYKDHLLYFDTEKTRKALGERDLSCLPLTEGVQHT